jgi:hypothetical protein
VAQARDAQNEEETPEFVHHIKAPPLLVFVVGG